MNQIIYVSDSMKQAIDFINNLISDLQQLGIKDIRHDREHNFIVVGNTEVRGISLYESCLCIKIHDAKYFIDGIDMSNYKCASKERLDSLIYHIREAMLHFREDTKQLSGKDELIKILTEKKFMCEFCEEPTKNIKWHRQDTDTNISECFIHGASDGYAMFLRQGLKVTITDDLKTKISQLNEYAYIDIKYCPFCGRKLTEAENNSEMKPIIHAHAIIDWLGNPKCSNCGSKNIDVTEPYCQHCGASFDEPEERED